MNLNSNEMIFNASLSCIDLGHIEKSMNEINQSSISSLHYDIVDGIFNKCFIFGDLGIKIFKQYTHLPITVHLACQNPDLYLEPVIRNGADYVAIHYESDTDLVSTFQKIRDLGAKPVLAFRCDTEVPDDLLKLSKEVEWILKLTVHPGFSGQEFYQDSLRHIQKMYDILGDTKRIEVDGNIHKNTIGQCMEVGATMFTLGTSGLFNHQATLDENIQLLKNQRR